MFRARRSPLPDEVYRELVDILFRALTPLIVMAVAVTGIGAAMFAMTRDPFIAGLTLASLFLTVTRVGLTLSYRGRTAATISLAEVKTWENAFGAGAVLAGVVLGLLNARALLVGDPGVHMLAVALTFGFCSGAIIRLSVRPLIAVLTLFAVASLTLFGFVAHAYLNEGPLALAYRGQGVVIALFAIASLEMIQHLYRTTVLQLTTKAELAQLARKDALTGLANRIALRECFDREMTMLQPAGEFIALHFLDLDRFKAVNDNHGHPTGDVLLQMVAGRLGRMLRAGDAAARLGGDEFVVLQSRIRDPAEAEMLARRIVKEISAPYRIDGKVLHVGASVGVAMAPTDGVELDHVAARGDAALYEAKSTRRGTVGFSQAAKSPAKGAA